MKTISKKVILVALLLAAALTLTACQTNQPAPTATTAPTAEPTTAPAAETPADTETAAIPDKTFTLEELATFTGKDGNAAYVAVDGIVYDVTNVTAWKDGSHAGGSLQAGADMTEALKGAPHGADNLNAAVIVGRLAQ